MAKFIERVFSGVQPTGNLHSFSGRKLAAWGRRAPKLTVATGMLVFRRPDGCLRIELAYDILPADAAAVYFIGFRDHDDAAEVRQGALVRLSKHLAADGWLTGLSVGQALAAIRAETGALGMAATIARVRKAADAGNIVAYLARCRALSPLRHLQRLLPRL